VKPYGWNQQKNSRLKLEKEISFEAVVDAINQGNLLETLERPNKSKYGNQKIYFIKIQEYVYPHVALKRDTLLLSCRF